MSNVNDNNLDDLLRRAAEKYPLRTDSADWGKLVSDLERDPSLILPPANGEDKRRRRRFFWLFLLLPLAGVGYYTWHGRSASLGGQPNMVAEKPANVKPEQPEHVGGMDAQAGEKGGQNGQAGVTAGKDGQVQASEPGHDRLANAVAGKEGQTSEPGQIADNKVAGEKGGHVGGETAGRKGPSGAAAGRSGQIGGRTANGGHVGGETAQGGDVGGEIAQRGHVGGEIAQGGHVGGETVGLAATVRPRKGGRVGGETTRGETAGGENAGRADLSSGTGHADRTSAPIAGGNGVKSVQNENEPHLAGNNLQRANMRGDVSVNIPVKSNTVNQTKDNTKDKVKLQKPKPSFYVGILGSPDLSTIKWQSVKNVGNRYGLLLGYSFNSRWAIESGVYFSKKKYYTDGEYFDKTKVYMLNYIDKLKVDGVCNMWEIPVSVRYNLSSGEKTKWFATAGVSAYYMSREKYYCTGYWNGNPWAKGWDTTAVPHKWSANLNLSVGYEQRLGEIGNLRLEPYVSVPMSGIGTGKLSIMSAGLNIGITRRIW